MVLGEAVADVPGVAGIGLGRVTSLSRYTIVSGGFILPRPRPDRPAIWEMPVEKFADAGCVLSVAMERRRVNQ